MIEIVNDKEMKKEEAGQLPKNIRQIGEREKNRRIYIEDYVITYINQLRDTAKEEQRVLILYGRREIVEFMPTWFINGVLETEAEPFYEANLIDEHDWQEINLKAAKYFPGLSVLGWAVIGQEDITEYMDQIELTWRQFFREDQQIFFYSCVSEMTEDIYCFDKGHLNRLHGYYVYYEKNENMQNYMLSARQKTEEEMAGQNYIKGNEVGNDHATRQFRSIVQEKKEEIHRKRTMSFLYAASSLLVMVIMVIGITMLNNYEKMENMESTLKKISGQVEDGFAAKETAQQAMAIDQTAEEQQTKEKNEKEDNVSGDNKNLSEGAEAEKEEHEQMTQAEEQSEGMAEGPDQNQVNEQAAQTVQPDVTVQSDGNVQSAETTQQNEVIQPQETEQTSSEPSYTIYEVQRGDTLAKICIRFYGNEDRVQEICDLNEIKDKDTILYGQKILLP